MQRLLNAIERCARSLESLRRLCLINENCRRTIRFLAYRFLFVVSRPKLEYLIALCRLITFDVKHVSGVVFEIFDVHAFDFGLNIHISAA